MNVSRKIRRAVYHVLGYPRCELWLPSPLVEFCKSSWSTIIAWMASRVMLLVGVVKQGCANNTRESKEASRDMESSLGSWLESLPSGPDAYAVRCVGSVPEDMSRVHTHDHNGSKVCLSCLAQSLVPKPLGLFRPPPPPFLYCFLESHLLSPISKLTRCEVPIDSLVKYGDLTILVHPLVAYIQVFVYHVMELSKLSSTRADKPHNLSLDISGLVTASDESLSGCYLRSRFGLDHLDDGYSHGQKSSQPLPSCGWDMEVWGGLSSTGLQQIVEWPGAMCSSSPPPRPHSFLILSLASS
ncbi:hypothetical protein Tco_0874637 [Tanacetum coccineum]|uniref:Uncharacterized protein n=1 Tax=Tanacetum coccineum TaxID=301880 RepID=A0ABQ5BQ99_9ASTR